MTARTDAYVVHLTLGAITRFVRDLILWGAPIAVAAAAGAFVLSSRSEPVFTASASIVAPKRNLNLNLVEDEPTTTAPLDAFAYAAVVHREDVLLATWHSLSTLGAVSGEPSVAALAELSSALRVDADDERLSLMMFVQAAAPTATLAMMRASAAANAIIAWDDGRASLAAERAVSLLETQQDALEAQVQQLLALGDRASLAQTASISQLLADNRHDLGLARSQAVAARGALDLVQDAVSASQVRPRPIYDGMTASLLTVLAVAVALLIRGAVRTRFSRPEGMAEVSGLPLLATFSTAPGGDLERVRVARPQLGASRRALAPRAQPTAAGSLVTLPFLKAHVDRALPQGGRLLIVGVGPHDGARPVAAALAAQYRTRSTRAGNVSVSTGPALLTAASAVEEAAAADATVLVADPKSTTRRELEQALEWLRLANAKVVGIVSSPGRDPTELAVGLRGTP